MTERERQLTEALRRLAMAVIGHALVEDPQGHVSVEEVMAALRQSRELVNDMMDQMERGT
jgi:hypothetical protein